ncbi:MAG: hypothetical protein FJ027_05455 [Candidatus Rokubacteria bacterium]|nr:hypothetical protein [Candidatus Rokubacteria bacterium]
MTADGEAIAEAVTIRLHRARSWRRKAARAQDAKDLDGEFIFLWIAFNALYGTPRYHSRGSDPESRGEVTDFKRFTASVDRVSRGRLTALLKRPDVEGDMRKVMESPFLDRDCWIIWDNHGIRDRGERRNTANVQRGGRNIEQLLRNIYTLRNQVLHGAATAVGRINRDTLEQATRVMRAMVGACIDIVDEHRSAIAGMLPLPYPPSTGTGGGWNPPRIAPRR